MWKSVHNYILTLQEKQQPADSLNEKLFCLITTVYQRTFSQNNGKKQQDYAGCYSKWKCHFTSFQVLSQKSLLQTQKHMRSDGF